MFLFGDNPFLALYAAGAGVKFHLDFDLFGGVCSVDQSFFNLLVVVITTKTEAADYTKDITIQLSKLTSGQAFKIRLLRRLVMTISVPLPRHQKRVNLF